MVWTGEIEMFVIFAIVVWHPYMNTSVEDLQATCWGK
jgi:hypothetical protein